jgi:hypothetical protein
MTRSKRRPAKRASAIKSLLKWEDKHRELFRFADDSWTQPSDIQVRHGVRSWTLTAKFLMPCGKAVTLTIRIKETGGRMVLADERMAISMSSRKPA